MSSKTEKDKAKQLQDKCQAVLTDLLRDEDNKYCVDCDSKGPRWASWNLGVFLCIRCAGIHRNLGVHISKVKSVNLDAWTPEQVVSLQQMGNSRARAVYEANIPDNFRRPQNDTSLETFIRAKYEHKKYIAKEWVPPPLPKVNWEKDIEEELDRQKRKKKSLVEKKSLGMVEVPQLPKPKNPSPKPVRAVGTVVAATNEDKQVTDLLALQNGEDGFSNFLSAPPKEEVKKDENKEIVKEKDAGKSEEESFFNQPAPTEKEKAKMTKDSILALYGNAPPINNFNPTYSTPYNNFPAQQNFQNFNFPNQQQSFPVQNGSQQFQQQSVSIPTHPNQFQMNHPNQSSQFQPQFNQFQPTQGVSLPNQYQYQNQQFQQQQTNVAPQQYQGIPNQYNSVLYQPQNFGTKPSSVPNPFFGNQTGLQQQFSNLSLSSQPNTNTAPTLASNIWQ